jgi:hypothetical protein
VQSFVLRKTIDYEREALFYLDSMVKQSDLKAPQGEYRDSIPVHSGAFFIKTSENRYAAMIQVKMIIANTIDCIWYYWAYQPDSGNALFKNRISEQPAPLTITLDVFSGRPNPVFTLADSAAIAEVTHAIYVSVNTLLDSTIQRADTTTCNSGILDYRKMTVTGMFPFDNHKSSYQPSIELCGGKMTYYKVTPASTITQRVSLYDKNSQLEKLIIRICCEKNLSVTDQYGTVRFCDVIPDSLKPSTQIFHVLPSRELKNPVQIHREPNAVWIGCTHPLRDISIFSASGRMVKKLSLGEKTSIHSPVKINVRMMREGMYYALIETQGKSFFEKVIIVK